MTVRARLAVAVALALALLGGCTSTGQGAKDVSNQGYVSSDGSVATWEPGHRKGPVAVSGTDYAGEKQDVTGWLGDVVVVNTWYANCPPCRAEAPDLVALANDSIYGLTSSIYTADLGAAMRACNDLRFGETYINRENFEAMQGFHAGQRRSGIGGADGKHGLYEYTQSHVVYLQS